MAIPALTAEKVLRVMVGNYPVFRKASIVDPFLNSDLSRQVTIRPDQDHNAYLLMACARSHLDIGKIVDPPEHCFLKLVDSKSSPTIESLSFSYNQAAASPDYRADHPANRCETVQPISWQQWQQLRQYYQEQCPPEQFDMDTHNCCSCAQRSIQSVLGTPVPSNITRANNGLGTSPTVQPRSEN